jgi:hypothetical protein
MMISVAIDKGKKLCKAIKAVNIGLRKLVKGTVHLEQSLILYDDISYFYS